MAAITDYRFWDKIEEAVGPIDLHIKNARFSVEDLNIIHDIKHFVKSKPKKYWIEENNNLDPPQ